MENKVKKRENPEEEKPFVPKGAMTFFVLMILLFLVLWFVVYFVSITRIQ